MTMRYLLAVAVSLGVAGAGFAQSDVLPPPKPAPVPPPGPVAVAGPLPGLPQLAHEADAPPIYGAETAGLPPAIPSVESLTPAAGPIVWGSAEYLFWWVRNPPNPVPLASIAAPTGALEESNGLDGVGHFNGFSGGRLRLGVWFDGERTWGADIGGFWLHDANTTVAAGDDTTPLERIFFDANTGQPIIVPVNVPGVLQGTIAAEADLRFGGAEAEVRAAVWTHPFCRLELTAGYRFLDLQEGLTVLQESQNVSGTTIATPAFGTLPDGSLVRVFDKVQTLNTFNGAEVGVHGEWECGVLSLGVGGQVGLGAVEQEVRAEGATLLTNSTSFSGPGGLLVQSTNSGSASRVRAGFEAEVDVHAAVQVISCVRLIAGWSGLWWTGVLRPGNQLDTVINPALLPLGSAFRPGPAQAPARPAVTFHGSDFWANGFNVGLEISY